MRPSFQDLLTSGLLILCVPVFALRAAEPPGRLNGPIIGFFAEEGSLELRAIHGIPGAAVAGAPLPLPEGAARVRIAPGQRYALVEFAGASPPSVLDLAFAAAPAAIAGAMPRADLCAFSPTGSAAALYSTSEGRLQVLAGLPAEPRLVRTLSIGGAERIAVSDDAESLLYADASGEVFLALPDSQPAPVLRTSRLAGLSFLPDRRDAAILDGARGELHLVEAGATRLLASGLEEATALAPSANAASLFVAAAGSRRLWRVGAATGESRAIELPATPASLDALRLPGAFLISSRAGEPAWLLIAGDKEERAYFVPAVERELQ